MLRVQSNIHTAVAYTGEGDDVPAGTAAVEIRPGVNELTDEQAHVLDTDRNFHRHVKDGHMIVLRPDDGVAVTPPADDPPPPAPVPVDPRARLKGETKATWDARIIAMDRDAATVRDFYALSDADRAALYPTMSDADRALVDANKPKPE